MKAPLPPPFSTPPPDEDSPDLTDEELVNVIVTTDAEDFTTKVSEELRIAAPVKAYRFERRYRNGITYSRVRLDSGESLLFETGWLVL